MIRSSRTQIHTQSVCSRERERKLDSRSCQKSSEKRNNNNINSLFFFYFWFFCFVREGRLAATRVTDTSVCTVYTNVCTCVVVSLCCVCVCIDEPVSRLLKSLMKSVHDFFRYLWSLLSLLLFFISFLLWRWFIQSFEHAHTHTIHCDLFACLCAYMCPEQCARDQQVQSDCRHCSAVFFLLFNSHTYATQFNSILDSRAARKKQRFLIRVRIDSIPFSPPHVFSFAIDSQKANAKFANKAIENRKAFVLFSRCILYTQLSICQANRIQIRFRLLLKLGAMENYKCEYKLCDFRGKLY